MKMKKNEKAKIRKQRITLEFELTENQRDIDWNELTEKISDLNFWSINLK